MKKILLLIVLFSTFLLQAQEESLRVFDAYRGGGSTWIQYADLGNAWYDHVHQLADYHLDQRIHEVQVCDNLSTWELRKKRLQENLLKSIGGLPEKTPLNARSLETLERPTFTVEKLIYESLPQFYVTACLFLPKNRTEPAPAVIYCSGHAADAFRSPTYQRVIINLVEKGFIVLAFDPIGQGERYQYLDEQGKTNLGGPTKEHSYAGLQCMLQGRTIARYMIHDGMRAVDYLLTRPEVDPHRIGITGRSGGGTQAAYIAAFDDRIHAVAPENYITSFRRIWSAIGPQDAEQNFLSGLSRGIDHGDLLSIRAPKPALMLTTTRDYFSIQGARETFREVQQIYQLHKAERQFSFAEDDYQHGSTAANRESMNAFFQQALALPGDPTDREIELFPLEELTITEKGQVGSALNSRTVFDLNQQGPDRNDAPDDQKSLQAGIQAIMGVQEVPSAQTAVFTGRIQRADYTIEKYFLEFEKNHYPIPFLWVDGSSTKSGPIVLYLRSDGKEQGMQPGGEVEQLVQKGYTVIAPDLLNAGELHATSFQGDSHIGNISFNLILGSSLVGKSLTTFQTEDLMILMSHLEKEWNVEPERLIVIADGQYCTPIMHYAALNDAFEQVILRQPLASWQTLLKTERYQPSFAYSIVPGALPDYDLPDLLSLMRTEKLMLIEPLNASGKRLTDMEAQSVYQRSIDRYAIVTMEAKDIQQIIKWLGE